MFSKEWGFQKFTAIAMGTLLLTGASALTYKATKTIHRELTLKTYSFSFLNVSKTLENGWKTREISWDSSNPEQFKLIAYKAQPRKKILRNLLVTLRTVKEPEVITVQAKAVDTEIYADSFFDTRLTLAQQFERLTEFKVDPRNLIPHKRNPVQQEVKAVLISNGGASEEPAAPKKETVVATIAKNLGYSSPQNSKPHSIVRENKKQDDYSPVETNSDIVQNIEEIEEAPLPSISIKEMTPVPMAKAQAPPEIENEIKIIASTSIAGVGPQPKTAPNYVIKIEPKQNPTVAALNTQVSIQGGTANDYPDNKQNTGNKNLFGDTARIDGTENSCSNYQVFCLSPGIALTQLEKPYENINFKILSHEGGSENSTQVWGITQKKDAWPTLSLEKRELSLFVPVLPNTSVAALSSHRKHSIQNNTGIVFGKIPAEYTVQMGKAEESRSDVVLYVHEADRSHERTFVFLNVTPGPQLVYLYDARGVNLGAVTVPTLQETATYLDLRSVNKESVSGVLLNSGKALIGVANTPVRVLGQWNQKAETDAGGRFIFKQVNRFGSYPLYVESECSSGYTHRYKTQNQNIFYCFTESMIQSWMLQFQGGVSEDSGVIVGAVPSVAQKYEEGQLFPELKTHALRGSTTPEIYTLSPEGKAQIHTPLDKDLPRFLGIQLPYAAVVSEVVDRAQRVVWSEMVFSSPRVLQVLGPY